MATDYEGRAEKGRVQGPAIGLIVAGSLYVLSGLWYAYSGSVVSSAEGQRTMQEAVEKAKRDNPRMTKEEEKLLRGYMESFTAYAGPGYAIWGLLQVILGVVTICGAVSMLNLKSSAMAMTGAISAAIPCALCCWPVGLPFAIWAIVTLSHPAVKLAFQQAQGDRF